MHDFFTSKKNFGDRLFQSSCIVMILWRQTSDTVFVQTVKVFVMFFIWHRVTWPWDMTVWSVTRSPRICLSFLEIAPVIKHVGEISSRTYSSLAFSVCDSQHLHEAQNKQTFISALGASGVCKQIRNVLASRQHLSWGSIMHYACVITELEKISVQVSVLYSYVTHAASEKFSSALWMTSLSISHFSPAASWRRGDLDQPGSIRVRKWCVRLV